MPLFNSQPDSEFDKLYAEYKRRGEQNDLLRQKKGVPPESPEVIDARARKQAEEDIARKRESESVRTEMQKRELEKPNTPGLFERLSSKPTQPTAMPQMQQAEPSVGTEGPAATAPDKGVSGGVRNLSENVAPVKGKPADISTKQASPQKVENTLDKLEEKVRIFNQRGFETGDFKEQLTEARRVYEEDRDRNRALGLAQMVAQSIARMGAAIEGNKRGRYIGDINSPSVDYEARNAEARADYRDQVSDISARQKEAVGETKYKHEQEVGALERRIKDEQLRYQEQQHNIRAQAAENRNDLRAQMAKNERLDELAAQEEKRLQGQQRAVESLAGAINSTDKKVQAQIPALVSKAGMDQAQYEQMLEEAPKEKGMLWDSESSALQSDYVKQSLLGPIQDRLKQLAEERRGYANVSAGKPQQAAPQPAQSTGQTPMPRVLSEEDKQALAWVKAEEAKARANNTPVDPRVAEIKKRLGVQ